jgi:hypothetical protein
MSAPPRSYAGAAADEGTRLHEVAERILSNSSLLWPPTLHDGDEMVRPYIEYCKALIDICDRFGIESRVSLDSFAPVSGQYGTADFWAYADRTLHVIDLKTGSIPVSPESEQLIAYAAGVLHDQFRHAPHMVTHVQLTIVQQNHISHWRLDLEEFYRELKTLSNALKEAVSLNPPFYPSDAACQYCPAAGICKARAALFTGIEHLDAASVQHLHPLENAERILAFKPKVDKYFKQLEATLMDAAKDGAELKFFELGKTKPHRAWSTISTDAFINACRQAGIADATALLTPVSPAKAETALGKKLFKSTLAGLVFTPVGEDKLVLKVFGEQP